MNAYQEKWTAMFQQAQIPGWKIKAQGENIEIFVPKDIDLKVVRDNFPETVAAMALDIQLPKERLKFILHNGQTNTEYILNPTEEDLNKA